MARTVTTLVAILAGLTLVCGIAQAHGVRGLHRHHAEPQRHFDQHHHDRHDGHFDHHQGQDSFAHFERWHPTQHVDHDDSHHGDGDHDRDDRHVSHGHDRDHHDNQRSGAFSRQWRAGDWDN